MKILNPINTYTRKVSNLIPESFILLLGRVAVFFVFWRSVQTKIDGVTIAGQNFAFWNVTESTFMLFEYEYELPMPTVMAYLGSFGEFFLSIGLLLGFFTRISAIGLIVMTAVIQFVYPEAWTLHILWVGILFYLLKNGAGDLSLDHLMKQK